MDVKGKKLGVGIRGAGQVAFEHARAISDNPHLYLAAVCSRTPENAKKLTEKLAPAARLYDSYEAMLDDPDVKVVSVCMPNYMHASEAIKALNADKHLILEKPPAITYEELYLLKSAATKAKTSKSVVSFVLRWHPMIVKLKEILDAGGIGRIFHAEADYWHGIKTTFASYPWMRKKEYAGGAMITGGCHAADIIRYLKGDEIVEVCAYRTKARDDFDYHTTLVAAAKFADGTTGKLSVSLDGINFPYQFNINLLGTEGLIRDNRVWSKKFYPEARDFTLLDVPTPNSGTVSHHPFKQEIDNLADGIVKGTPIISDVLDACKSIEISLAIEESGRTGKPVKVGL
jgi:predicted dehydrogenase